MHVILFDTPSRNYLHPFTYTRPVADIRYGILTIREWWSAYFNTQAGALTIAYLQTEKITDSEDVLYINSQVIPDDIILAEIARLKPGETLLQEKLIIASRDSTIQKVILTDNFLHGD